MVFEHIYTEIKTILIIVLSFDVKNLQNFLLFFFFLLHFDWKSSIVDQNLIVMKRGTVDLCKMFTYGILFGEVTGQFS